MQKPFRALLAIVLLALAGLGHAQVVTYTFTGNGNGNVGALAFGGQAFTFTVTAPAATVQNAVAPFSDVLSGGTIAIAGTPCAAGCAITAPSNYLVFNTAGLFSVHGISVVGHLDAFGSTLIEACYNCGGTPVNDNLVTPVAPTVSGAAGDLLPYFAFATSGGVVQITGLNTEITYSASTSGSASVPALSPKGLLLLAALLVLGGAIALKRRRV